MHPDRSVFIHGDFRDLSYITGEREIATPLLWVLRDTLALTGTKYGCGMAQCGACPVHLNGEAIRSCVKRVSDAAGKEITTIEGLAADLSHPLQKAWMEINLATTAVIIPGI